LFIAENIVIHDLPLRWSEHSLKLVATGGAEIATAKQYDFHLHAELYVGSSGSSDSIRFDSVVGGVFRISIFSIRPKLF
jgi:hypothetical protein